MLMVTNFCVHGWGVWVQGRGEAGDVWIKPWGNTSYQCSQCDICQINDVIITMNIMFSFVYLFEV